MPAPPHAFVEPACVVTQLVEYESDDVEDEMASEADDYEWEGMDSYDRMLVAYAYDNDAFEWSFESVEAMGLLESTACV